MYCVMKAIIDVFRMEEVSKETRCKIMIRLWRAIDEEYQMSITKDLVSELVTQLCPEHEYLKD